MVSMVFPHNSLTLSDEIVVGDKKMSWSKYYSFKWVEHSQAITAVSAEGGTGNGCWDVDNQIAWEVATR